MKLNPIKANMTEVVFNDKITILFSYKTPVACFNRWRFKVRYVKCFYKTDKFWSVTTSRHINQWLRENGIDPAKCQTLTQDHLDMIGAQVT